MPPHESSLAALKQPTNPAAILNAMANSAMTNDTHSYHRPQQAPSTLAVWLLLAAIFAAVQFASLFSPPLLDDVDAAHAQAAQHMAETGDLITAKIDGIRYIEKPPLPYWIVAGSYKIFGENTFATHLPNALAMLGLTWLAWLWARRAWGAAPASTPASACSPPSDRFSLPASSFPRRSSAFFCSSLSTA